VTDASMLDVPISRLLPSARAGTVIWTSVGWRRWPWLREGKE
jgi:hypothetical protein